MTNSPTTRETADHAELTRLAEAATQGPWDRMAGRGLVRAIRDDLAVPLFEPLEPYSDPLLDAPTCRVGGEVVFRANSQAARESAAIRQAVHNGNFIAAANPARVLALLSEIAALRSAKWDVQHADTMNDIVLMGMARDEAINRATQAERQRDELRKALESVRDLGSDGEHSGDRHARCRAIARQALSNQGADQ